MCRNGGLSDVHAEGRVTMERGGSIYAAGLMHSFRRFSAIGAMASLGQDKLDRTLALLMDPEFAVMSQAFMSVRGQQPG